MAASQRGMTKSALALARTALEVAGSRLAPYSHPCSPRKFKQAQLVAMLVVRRFFDLDYRGMVQLLADWSDLREAVGIRRLPHFTTLQKADARLLKKGASIASWMDRFVSRTSAA